MPKTSPAYAYTTHLTHIPTTPPHNSKHNTLRPLLILSSILLILAIFHLILTIHTSIPNSPPLTCQNLIRTTNYMDYVQFHAPQQELSAIQFVDQLVGGAPAALVPVIDTDSQQSLDIYIYGCSIEHHTPQLRLLFKQQDLLQGSVQISKNNTLLVGSLDPTLSVGTDMQIEPWQQTIYHEYAWQHNAFIPLIFPGFYPVLTRSEGELLQNQLNDGQQLPWKDPLTTSRQFALDLLHWSPHDLQSHLQAITLTSAHILLSRKHPITQLQVTVTRLIQPDQHGIWFVTAARSSDFSLDQAQFYNPLSSPLLLHGTLFQPPGTPAATLFNHLLLPLSLLNQPVLTIFSGHLFTTTLLYTNNVSGQPGLLLLENTAVSRSKNTDQLFLTGVILS